MSVSLEILNNNNSYRTTTATTTKSAIAAESKSVRIPTEENAEKSIPNVDSFVHGGGSVRFGAYSKAMAMKNNGVETASAVSKVQAKGTKGASNVYLDVIKNNAAKRVGLSISPVNGQIIVNGPSDARKVNAYNNERSRMQGTFWCQTGGWTALPGDGSDSCARTAAATMASLNTKYTVTPNDTSGTASEGLTGITVNGKYKSFDNNAGRYNSWTGPKEGLNEYSCGSEAGVISAINNELKNGRSVLVKTTVSGGHWVTVTGTLNGKEAKSFSDFKGVDPWYNGNNPNNPHPGTGDYAWKDNRAGEIQLSDVTNQKIHSDYKIITYKE